jgi:acetone carboxylase gamma subunit
MNVGYRYVILWPSRDKFNIHGRSVKRNKVSFSSSKWWSGEKESDNTKSKIRKNDADEEKQIKPKLSLKNWFWRTQQRIIVFSCKTYMQLEAAKEGVILYSEQEPKKAFHFIDLH